LEENVQIGRTSNLNQDQRILLQKVVDNGFKEWLQTSGNSKQLEQLTIVSISSQIGNNYNNMH
jgi:hypothetical protein